MAYTIINNNVFCKIEKLTGKSLFVYLLLRSKMRYRVNSDIVVDDIVTLTYSAASKSGISKMSFCRAIRQLISVDLIEIDLQGRFGGIPRKTSYKIK